MPWLRPDRLITPLLAFLIVLVAGIFYFEVKLVRSGEPSLLQSFTSGGREVPTVPRQQAWDSVRIELEKLIENRKESPGGIRFIRKRFVETERGPMGDYLVLAADIQNRDRLVADVRDLLEKLLFSCRLKTREDNMIIYQGGDPLFIIKVRTGYTAAVSVIIDDCGYSTPLAKEFLELDSRIAMAVLPYLTASRKFADRAYEKGFDVMLHLPMEPSGSAADPGPDAILTKLTEREILRRVGKALDGVGEHIIGVNNHMGSKASSDARVVRVVLGEIRRRGLFCVDSRTSSRSVIYDLARNMGVLTQTRDVFLDNTRTVEAVRRQWNQLLRLARLNGAALAIGHVTSEPTLKVLQEELPRLQEKGILLLPVSEYVKGYSGKSDPEKLSRVEQGFTLGEAG